jgi:hypothetical protein
MEEAFFDKKIPSKLKQDFSTEGSSPAKDLGLRST